MSDLFDDARMVRDATMAEYRRVQDPNTPEPINAGYELGIHLSSLVMTAVAKRLGGACGIMEAGGLMEFYTVAVAQVLSYGATSFRPIVDGKEIKQTVNVINLANGIVAYAMQQVALQEQGQTDFLVPFELKADGSVGVKAFDFTDMLKGKP